MARKSRVRKSADKGFARLQWACACAGLLITAAAIAILASAAFRPQSPPDLSIRALAVRPSTQGWVLEAEVSNQGDLTAAQIQVEGVAGAEIAHATLDYVPGHGAKAAVFIFEHDPRDGAQLRVRGWSTP